MSVLPIVDRELRVAARRSGTYWMRFWSALAVLAIWLVLLKSSRSVSPAQMGQHLLNALGILALVFSMLAGVFLTSDCLSEEKREGTLGLLFLTDLKGYDVVFGKLAANSLAAFFGLLAIFPILGLALLIGGVTGLEFARLMLVIVVTLFFSLSMGMVVSAVSREAKQAVTNAFLLVLIFAGVCPALWWFHLLFSSRGGWDFLLWPSPGYVYLEGFEAYYGSWTGAHEFWCSMGTLFGLGLGGIVFANVVLPRSWQEGAPAVPVKGRVKWRGGFAKKTPLAFHAPDKGMLVDYQGPPHRRNLRLPDGWIEPMYWLAARDGAPRRAARRMLLLMSPIWLALLVASVLISPQMNRIKAFVAALFSAYALHLVVKVLIAAEAGRRMNQDRRSGAWELLLVTPLRVEAILRGQMQALRSHFRWAVLSLVLVNGAMVETVLIFSKSLNMQTRDQSLFCEMFCGGMVALLADFYGLSWVGMWRGLNARQYHRGVLATLGQIMSVPLLFFFFMMFLQPNISENEVALVIGLWFMTGVIVSLVSGFSAKLRLMKGFRAAVLASNRTETGAPGGGVG